ncbi:endo-1,3-beta-xylanase [Flavobacterium zhairuonense]|uniref:glycoside hydrolase family 26 protein n=1 Tax=Flavobacterium zhairuonense TaxID=2493631 RepID=UPI0013C301C6|nr:glycosyl hydrolase [Flavobacterium zhairuonense]KAF2514724.1 endo-1,3-beta-xylanase [Flavobacterium zhairuonense]
MKLRYITIIGFCFLMLSCKQNAAKEKVAERKEQKRAKFEPEDGEVILFIGQENDALGGTEKDKNGYLDHFPAPGGFTMYTDIMPGVTEEFDGHSFTYTGLNGIYETADWGDGPENMSLQLNSLNFKNSALAIGLAIIDSEEKIASGELDPYILKMGTFFKSLGIRPVFLRIGFEFDGPWNRYERVAYINAFRHIKDKLDEQGVTNVAYVWQSKGFESTLKNLEEWYPGDDYVDWCGLSFFNNYKQEKMIAFAKAKNKPVFICEAAPTVTDWENDLKGNTGLTKKMILSNPEQAKMAWDEWFVPFFKTINDNPKTVKAISYINANWKDKPRWKVNPTFKGIDSRLQLSDFITKKWNEEVGKDKYLKASPDLFDKLYN